MIFNELVIKTNDIGYELVAGVLLGAGVISFATEDRNDLDDILNSNIPVDYVEESLLAENSGIVTIKAYLADNEQGKNMLGNILNGIEKLKKESEFELGSLDVAISKVNDREWADNWKEFFHPIKIGEKFIVKPSWEECTDDDRTIIEIDPESSFGTGQHETTALCLEMLEEIENDGKSVLDMGCGSGILGIASAKLGAERVLCVDIDKNATDIAEKNAVVNKLKNGRFFVLCGNILEDKTAYDRVCSQRYDIIMANIVADTIKEMTPVFKRVLNKNGTLICSGIISIKKDDILKALTNGGFVVSDIKEKNDWVAVKCIQTMTLER